MSFTHTIPTLQTERLTMRAFREEDVAHEAAFYQTDRAQYVGGPMPREQVWRMLASMVGHWAFRGYGFWAVEETSTGRYIGHVGLWYPEGWPEREIGWTTMDWAEGQGFAREAALAARNYAYGTLGWQTAISLIAPENARSIALAERLGARHDGEFEHERYGTCLIYRHPGPEALT